MKTTATNIGGHVARWYDRHECPEGSVHTVLIQKFENEIETDSQQKTFDAIQKAFDDAHKARMAMLDKMFEEAQAKKQDD